jgi:hypothetical protein
MYLKAFNGNIVSFGSVPIFAKRATPPFCFLNEILKFELISESMLSEVQRFQFESLSVTNSTWIRLILLKDFSSQW